MDEGRIVGAGDTGDGEEPADPAKRMNGSGSPATSGPRGTTSEDGDVATTLALIQERVTELRDQMRRFERLLKGNGQGGLSGEVQLHAVKIETLQRQWKWVVGILVMLALAITQALLRR